MHHLRRHLPPAGRILDAGGGPGRYSLELCKAGYKVVLLDLSPGNIALAKGKAELQSQEAQESCLEFVVGDVRDLSRFGSDSFDAVLCLDPLTYLDTAADRTQALSELVRVARPGGIVCITVRGYLALCRTLLQIDSDCLLKPEFETFVETGDISIFGIMCHFFRADEIKELAESCGLTTLEMTGCQGLSAGLAEATNLLGQEKAKWKRWVDLVLETATEPAVIDMAEHILYVGQKTVR